MSFILPGKFIYLSHPRTASVATEEVLKDAFPNGTVTREHHARIDNHEITGPATGEEVVYTTIRDPLDAMASWWTLNADWRKRGLLDFINQYRHTYLEVDGYMFYHYKAAQGRTLKYEDLQRDLNDLLYIYGAHARDIPVRNKTKNKSDYITIYCDNTVEAMWNRFPWDMSLYHVRGV